MIDQKIIINAKTSQLRHDCTKDDANMRLTKSKLRLGFAKAKKGFATKLITPQVMSQLCHCYCHHKHGKMAPGSSKGCRILPICARYTRTCKWRQENLRTKVST